MKRDHSRPKIGTKWRILQGCALAALLALMSAGAAKADTFTCDTVPSSFSGDIDISQTDACVITTGLSATGHINITAPSVIVNGDVSAGAYLSVTANASSINIAGNVSFNTALNGANALLFAQTDIATGSITAAQGGTAAVDVKANLGGGNDLFTVNGSGQSNGVNGPISAGGVYVTNGTDASTGGITLSGTAPVTIQSYSGSSGSASGLFLDAKLGVITLPGGTLSADASGSGLPAGSVILAAAEVDAPSGAVLSASDDGTGSGFISIGATTVNSGSDLTVHADGGNKTVSFVPTGNITFTDTQDPNDLEWSASPNVYGSSGNLTLNVSGSAFLATSNGFNSGLDVAGDNIAITANELTLQSQGNSNSMVFINGGGGNSLAFNITDATNIDVSGAPGGAGGNIALYPNNLTITGNTFTVNANGPTTGDGAGGFIISYASAPTFDPTVTSGVVTANASGAANGGSIYLQDLIGSQITANAGTSGTAGLISISPSSDFAPESVLISANGGTTGNGGQVTINLQGGDYIDSSDTITAMGGSSSGNGGVLTLNTQDLTLSYPDIDVSAPGTGNGGTFNASIGGGNTMYAVGTINAQAQVDGQGGQVNFTGPAGIYSTINASGANSGNGGSISISGNSFLLQYGGQLLVNGGANASGGTISVTTTGSDTLDWSTAGAISLNAGATSGNGGNLTVTSASDIIFGGTVSANGSGTTGNGGTIAVNSTTPVDLSDLVQNSISALGAGSGQGGQVAFTSVSAEPAGVSIDKVIAVSAGANFHDKAGFDGSIALNGITCQQWIGYPSWPSSYWNCANPTQPTDNENKAAAAAASLPSSFITTLSNAPSVAIYVMSKGSDFSTFFQYPGVDDSAFGTQVSALNLAAVFDNSTAPGTSTDVSAYLSGALMHQLGLLLDAYNSSPSQQTGAGTFGNASLADQTLMIGNYPASPQSPTCTDVFNDSTFCGTHSADANPWVSFQNTYIGSQNTNSEMFAYAFQNCSGNAAYSPALNNVEQSSYMQNVYGWMNTSFWPGGCNWISPSQPTGTLTASLVTNKPEQAVIGGSVTVGDTLTITVQDAGLSGGQEQVSYIVQTGDTQATIAAGLTQAIQDDVLLQAIGVSAVNTVESSNQVINIVSTSPNTTTYVASVNTSGTETVGLSVNPNVVENAVIGGMPTVGDTVAVTITDAGLPGGQQTISYTVASTDTVTSIATGLVANASSNTALNQIGITATSASGVVTFKSKSLNSTTYTASNTGTSETIALSVNPNSIEDVVIGGTPFTGNIITIGVTDASLANSEYVAYQVQPGDTVATIACNIQSALNADTNLTQLGISATCNSSGTSGTPGTTGTVSIESDSSNQTYFAIPGGILAQLPRCSYVTPFKGQGYLKACGRAKPDDDQVQIVRSTLESLEDSSAVPGGFLAPNAVAQLKSAYWLVTYVFKNPSEYEDLRFFPPAEAAAAGAPPFIGAIFPNARGASYFSHQDPALFPFYPYSALFEIYSIPSTENPGLMVPTLNDQMAHTTAHEIGHQVDNLYGANSITAFTNSTPFINALNNDITFMAFVPPCLVGASDRNHVPPSGNLSGDFGNYGMVNGFFTSAQDAEGNLICSGPDLQSPYVLTGAGSGSANLDIIKLAYPNIAYALEFDPFDPYEDQSAYPEMFAEEYADIVGFVDTPDGATGPAYGSHLVFDSVHAFKCSVLYTTQLIHDGTAPDSTQLSSTSVAQPLSFGGDSSGVLFGPPEQHVPPFGLTGFGQANAVTNHNCDGTTTDGGSYIFGGD